MQKKRIISTVLCVAIIASCFAFGFKAFAISHRLLLDVKYTDTINGEEDTVKYLFTPEVSGTYTFMSYNVPRSEAYLFVKEMNAAETEKVMVQLAYSQSSPNYRERGQTNSMQFCLTYHLEAGKTYYYTAGWWMETRTEGSMTVMLTCDEYDNEAIESVYASSTATLSDSVDGSWATDSAGNSYFRYDYSKVVQNMTVTVTYKDGSVSSVSNGASSIDGYSILYKENQAENHWYPNGSGLCTGNVITVTVLNKSYEYSVIIEHSLKCRVMLKVVDNVTGEAVSGATVSQGSNDIGSTNGEGIATVSLLPGSNSLKIRYENAISRELTIIVNVSATDRDLSGEPIGLATGDYNSDGIINAKDYAYITKTFGGNKKTAEIEKFESQINFTAADYTPLQF